MRENGLNILADILCLTVSTHMSGIIAITENDQENTTTEKNVKPNEKKEIRKKWVGTLGEFIYFKDTRIQYRWQHKRLSTWWQQGVQWNESDGD